MGYHKYGLPTSDLISEGNIGLMQAINRFDPGGVLGSRPTRSGGSKATQAILRSWSLVKMVTEIRRSYFQPGQGKRRLSGAQEAIYAGE
jgi:RNA polymerase sigma-32 factor